MSTKKYLITGGLGLIGSNLANNLPGKITVVNRSSRNVHRIKRKDIQIILKPINQLIINELKNVDVIYHCASTVDNYHVLTDPYIDIKTNLEGTTHLLELCKKLTKRPKIIFLSTFFVYGNTYDKTHVPINEESQTDPLAIYPATKLCAESIIKLYSRLYHIPYLICRLTNVYGEEEDYDNKKKGALNYLIMQAVKGEVLKIYKGGNFLRDYIHVDDVVSALTFLETNTNEMFLLGYGKPTKFKTIVDYILELTNNKSKVIEIEPPEFHKVVGVNNFVADTRKINKLGWTPKIPIKAGLRKVIERYKKLI